MKNLNAVAMEFQDTFSADRNQHSSILQMQSANKVNWQIQYYHFGVVSVNYGQLADGPTRRRQLADV